MGKTIVNRHVQYSGLPEFSVPGGSTEGHPFQVVGVQDDVVRINEPSYLMKQYDIRANVPILGLGYGFKVQYGEKVYLETVFDTAGQVAYARIENEAAWLIKKAATTTSGLPTLVYPAVIANLSKRDQAQYTEFLTDQTTRVTTQMASHKQYLQDQITNSELDQTTGQEKITKVSKLYQDALDKLKVMSTNQSTFFSSLPTTGTVRKQVSCYNMIAYTTKDDNAELNSMRLTPPDPTAGAGGDEDTEDKSFNLVQCLFKDLMLMDTFYQFTGDLYPVEFSRPVYYYLDPDTKIEEDIESTDPANLT